MDFISFFRKKYLYFPENFFVYALFYDWVPKKVDMQNFGHQIEIRIAEFTIIQILAMTIWKEKGDLSKKDYEVVISGVDRDISHSKKGMEIAKDYVKNLGMIKALYMLVL